MKDGAWVGAGSRLAGEGQPMDEQGGEVKTRRIEFKARGHLFDQTVVTEHIELCTKTSSLSRITAG
jgi:hypothetical protein